MSARALKLPGSGRLQVIRAGRLCCKVAPKFSPDGRVRPLDQTELPEQSVEETTIQ